MNRAWVNQPSTLQPHHRLHGTLVLASPVEAGATAVRIWFLSGPVVGQLLIKEALSYGWPEHLRKQQVDPTGMVVSFRDGH